MDPYVFIFTTMLFMVIVLNTIVLYRLEQLHFIERKDLYDRIMADSFRDLKEAEQPAPRGRSGLNARMQNDLKRSGVLKDGE